MARNAKLKLLKRRQRDGHKGSYGKILVIAGSRAMPGAAHLAAIGALRGGAGLVTLATSASALPLIAPGAPCATYLPLPETMLGSLGGPALQPILTRSEEADVVVLGPGLGQERATVQLVRKLVAGIRKPLLIDADGLNAVAGEPKCLLRRSSPTVLTPHPGELCRLDGGSLPTGAKERRARAEAAASRFKAIVCLKGHRTVVSDGQRTYLNDTGNPGMATGGSGDVLAGLLGALMAQFAEPFDAAMFAVHVHGTAGDLAADCHGEVSMIASDLLDTVGPAIDLTLRDL